MIRPFTCFTVLLAGIAGIYLYSSKHRVQLLDRQIEATMHEARAARDRTAILKAEWTLQNDPMRLKQLADKFLTLKPVTPNQFTNLADLDKRLPAPRARNAQPSPLPSEIADQEPAASETPNIASSSPPPSPEMKSVDNRVEATQPANAKPVEPKPTASHEAEEPQLQASRYARPKQQSVLTEQKRDAAHTTPVVARSLLATPALPRAVATMVAVPSASPPAPVAPTGMVSALGMARTVLAPPVPLPQSAAALDGN